MMPQDMYDALNRTIGSEPTVAQIDEWLGERLSSNEVRAWWEGPWRGGLRQAQVAEEAAAAAQAAAAQRAAAVQAAKDLLAAEGLTVSPAAKA